MANYMDGKHTDGSDQLPKGKRSKVATKPKVAKVAKKVAKVETAEKVENTLALKVTSVQVYPVVVDKPGKTRALARVQLNDALQLTGLRVMDGANGLFVSYPNDPNKGDDYRSLFYPVTKDLREHIEEEVLVKFQEMLAVG